MPKTHHAFNPDSSHYRGDRDLHPLETCAARRILKTHTTKLWCVFFHAVFFFPNKVWMPSITRRIASMIRRTAKTVCA